jgi:subtilisin-like proprotein convertase family protein
MSTLLKTALLSIVIIHLAACGIVDESPVVSITSPSDGEPVTGVVMMSVDAKAPEGVVMSVQFDLPNGTSVTDRMEPFEIEWDSTTVFDGVHTLRVTATDDGGTTATTAASFTVANHDCARQTFNASGLPRNIPDNNPDGMRSSIQANGNGSVTALSLSLSLMHPFPEDLSVKLISPTGMRFNVSGRNARHDNNVITIDDQAIEAFNGQSVEGAWTLAIQDGQRDDVGRLNAWSLSIAADCHTSAR